MAQSSRPDPANGRVVTDDEFERLARFYCTDGVYGAASDQNVVYADSTGRQVKVRPARQATVQGTLWMSDPTTDEIVGSLPANTAGNPRIDRLVLRYTRSTRLVRTQFLQGTAAASPTAPALTQNTSVTSGVWDFPLAQWSVANNYTTVAAGDVTNEAWYPQASGDIQCSSTSRPFGSALRTGQRIWEFDTGICMRYNGTAWSPDGLQRIDQQVLGSTTASVTFSGIPQYFTSLQLLISGRSTNASLTDGVLLRLNGDSGANYTYNSWQTNNSGGTSGNVTYGTIVSTGTAANLGDIYAASTVDARPAGSIRVQIPHYTNSTWTKQVISDSAANIGTTAWSTTHRFTSWFSSAAITSITVLPNSGSWAANTRITLLGTP